MMNDSGQSSTVATPYHHHETDPLLPKHQLARADTTTSLASSSSDTLFDSIRSDGLRKVLQDWLFPPHLPRECQLLRLENIALPTCYLLVGLSQGLLSALLNVLPLDLGATEAQQMTIAAISNLPASFKLVFGFLSDTCPIRGYRRKPYMWLGWILASTSLAILLLGSDLRGVAASNSTDCFGNEFAARRKSHASVGEAPSMSFLSVCLLGFGFGFWMADVMGDAIVAEKTRLEVTPESRGSVQSSCYAYRFFGMMVGAPLSTVLYSGVGPESVMILLTVLPLTILPLIYWLDETPSSKVVVRTPGEQCREIWTTITNRAVWQPLGFVYLYNALHVGNAAWREFLKTTLHFTSCQLNLLVVVALVLVWLGVVTYKQYFLNVSWRNVYIVGSFMNCLFSLLQILLIHGKTFGLSNFWFALGDDAFSQFITGIQFLPATIMLVNLCPPGSEGASYAMFTTVTNSAIVVSPILSTILLRIWDVSKAALQDGRLQGLENLTYLTTAIQVSGVLFVGLLPHYKDDLMRLRDKQQHSMLGGAMLLAVAFLTIAYSLTIGTLNIVVPGWMGES